MAVSKTHACALCDYAAANKSKLTRHLRIHTGERPFPCDQCNFAAVQKEHLITHMRVHTEDRPFACDHCDYRSVDKSELGRHLWIHTGEKRFVCELCDYTGNKQSNLTRHMRTHTGERPFACKSCKYTTARKDHLALHVNTCAARILAHKDLEGAEALLTMGAQAPSAPVSAPPPLAPIAVSFDAFPSAPLKFFPSVPPLTPMDLIDSPQQNGEG